MNKAKKWILRIAIGLVVLLIVVVLVIGLAVDSIVKASIETGGSYALGVATEVKSVDLGVFSGKATIDGLQVANPEGFKSECLMKSGRFHVAVTPGSLMSDTVEVTRFELDGLEMNIEQTLSGSNVKTILKNLEKFESDEEPTEEQPPAEEPPPGEGKKIKVDTILIKDVTARFYLLSSTPVPVRIPEMKLENITSDESGGVIIGRLMSRLIPAILAGVIEQAGDTVPGDFLKDLDGQVADVAKAAGGKAVQLVDQMSGEVSKATGVKEETVKEVTGALKGLFGGKKSADPNAKD